MNLFGQSKEKQAPAAASPASTGALDAALFDGLPTFHDTETLSRLFRYFKEETVSAKVERPRVMGMSLEAGRGTASIRGYALRKFGEEVRPVIFLNTPRSETGGSFAAVDQPLSPGEPIQFHYHMTIPTTKDARNLNFTAKGLYLNTSIYVPQDPNNPGKSWSGSREQAEKIFGKEYLVRGEEVLEIRISDVSAFSHRTSSLGREILSNYIFTPSLYIFPGGGPWSKRSQGSGRYFEGIPNDIPALIEKTEGLKAIMSGLVIVECGVDTISLTHPEMIMADIDHDSARPMLLRDPNKNLREINAGLGFLLEFEVSDPIREALARTIPNKAGKETFVYLPLSLAGTVQLSKGGWRYNFLIYPRDLLEDRGAQRKRGGLALKFAPLYALHPKSEDQNTYRKLMIAIGQRIKDDSKPENERAKIASVASAMEQRQREMHDKHVDDKLKQAFMKRQEARRQKDMGA